MSGGTDEWALQGELLVDDDILAVATRTDDDDITIHRRCRVNSRLDRTEEGASRHVGHARGEVLPRRIADTAVVDGVAAEAVAAEINAGVWCVPAREEIVGRSLVAVAWIAIIAGLQLHTDLVTRERVAEDMRIAAFGNFGQKVFVRVVSVLPARMADTKKRHPEGWRLWC